MREERELAFSTFKTLKKYKNTRSQPFIQSMSLILGNFKSQPSNSVGFGYRWNCFLQTEPAHCKPFETARSTHWPVNPVQTVRLPYFGRGFVGFGSGFYFCPPLVWDYNLETRLPWEDVECFSLFLCLLLFFPQKWSEQNLCKHRLWMNLGPLRPIHSKL